MSIKTLDATQIIERAKTRVYRDTLRADSRESRFEGISVMYTLLHALEYVNGRPFKGYDPKACPPYDARKVGGR